MGTKRRKKWSFAELRRGIRDFFTLQGSLQIKRQSWKGRGALLMES